MDIKHQNNQNIPQTSQNLISSNNQKFIYNSIRDRADQSFPWNYNSNRNDNRNKQQVRFEKRPYLNRKIHASDQQLTIAKNTINNQNSSLENNTNINNEISGVKFNVNLPNNPKNFKNQGVGRNFIQNNQRRDFGGNFNKNLAGNNFIPYPNKFNNPNLNQNYSSSNPSFGFNLENFNANSNKENIPVYSNLLFKQNASNFLPNNFNYNNYNQNFNQGLNLNHNNLISLQRENSQNNLQTFTTSMTQDKPKINSEINSSSNIKLIEDEFSKIQSSSDSSLDIDVDTEEKSFNRKRQSQKSLSLFKGNPGESNDNDQNSNMANSNSISTKGDLISISKLINSQNRKYLY
jgi:hypothetical protein